MTLQNILSIASIATDISSIVLYTESKRSKEDKCFNFDQMYVSSVSEFYVYIHGLKKMKY